jgi:hypothetical protein
MPSHPFPNLSKAIPRRRAARCTLAGLLAITVVATASLAIAFSSDPQTASDARAARVGAATASAGSQPVLVVDGVTVTDGDLAVYRAGVAANIEYMRGAIVDVPDPAAAEALAERLALIEAYGVEVVSVAAAIGAAMIEAEAGRDGLSPTVSEVAEYNEQRRATLNASPDIPGAAAARAYVDAIGEERYWEEIAPRETARELASQRVQQAVTADASGDPRRAWALHRQGLLDAVQITITDRDAVSAALLDQALTYLRAFLELETRQAGP